ncbi:MAG TPA: pitrilysin family protein, partial [Opitutaceae bacterium]|nr:pitrilysin family protein [Opitutaceae bacterium]
MITRLFHSHLRSLLFVSLLLFASSLRGAESKPFAHESSDLKPDSAIRFGKLPNGLKYAIAANAEPKGRASLRLLVEAGSFHETEAQRGLAHFLEHMAFNGSTHYPPGTLIEFFQRMGMNFGGDTNASTSFDRTLYLLELADTKEATLSEGLRIFSDYAGGLLLQPAELDRERGIILSEKRARDSVSFRTFVAQLEFILPDTLLPKRLPIGLTEIIEKAPREEFVDFYNAWYRPELISVVAVGDFDADFVEKHIKEIFTPLTARAPHRPKPNLGKVAPQPGIHAYYHPESESPNTSISLSTLAPFPGETDTSANRLKYLPRSLAHAMLNRRFAILARKENATFLSARASASEQYDLLRELSLDVNAKADQWEAALATGEHELRRALEFGFQPGELDDVRATFINSLEQSVNTAPTRRSPSLADEIAGDILRDSVTTHPRDELALYRPALERITTEDCLTALREAWSSTHRYVVVSGNAVIPGGKDAIAAAYQKSKSVPVTAPAAETAATWAYTQFGSAGKVISRDVINDLEITRVTFENGVRLNLKKTAFESNRIYFNTRVGSGSITEPTNQRGLAFLAGGTFDAGGLGKHSTDELMRIFAGKTVSVGFRPINDSFVFSGATNSRDLLLALQLLTAKITDP